MSDEELIVFLGERLDEDERAAVGAGGGPWEVGPAFGARENMVRIREQGVLVDSVGSCAEQWAFVGQTASIPNWRENAAHIARHDPYRVLREVEGKRQIIEEWEAVLSAVTDEVHTDPLLDTAQEVTRDRSLAMAWVVKVLALSYSEHPDYQDEWTP